MMELEQGDDDEKEEKRKLVDLWIKYLADWFPDLERKTYFVPPLHVNAKRLTGTSTESKAYSAVSDMSELAFQEEEISTSDIRYEHAQSLVVNRLHDFLTNSETEEVMVVLTKYEVSHYMDKSVTGDEMTKNQRKRRRLSNDRDLPSHYFPVPRESDEKGIQRGRFDILIIHKQYGFIVIQVKAIGDREMGESLNEAVMKRISKAKMKTEHLEKVLKHIISDVTVNIPISSVLALPHLDRRLLESALMKANDENAMTVSILYLIW